MFTRHISERDANHTYTSHHITPPDDTHELTHGLFLRIYAATILSDERLPAAAGEPSTSSTTGSRSSGVVRTRRTLVEEKRGAVMEAEGREGARRGKLESQNVCIQVLHR